ncbi:MAG TPA: hypothetical protein VK947_00090 [Planococcus sp. (in: firmicutes)]|nr:hypothetical protein [Planococcus sp. (in: firmicutes)]
MLLFKKSSDLIFWSGLAISALGLVYTLGYSNHDFFVYAMPVGFGFMAIGIFTGSFEKPEKK